MRSQKNIGEVEMEKAESLHPIPGINIHDVISQHEAKREERRLRHWVLKVCVSASAFVFVSTVIAMLWVFIVRGDAIDGGIFKTTVDALTEIIKFMVTPVQ